MTYIICEKLLIDKTAFHAICGWQLKAAVSHGFGGFWLTAGMGGGFGLCHGNQFLRNHQNMI